jgi:hypothetical protein
MVGVRKEIGGHGITLVGIVEDDAQGMSLSGAQSAHSMPEIDTIGSPRTADRAMMDCEGNRISSAKSHDFGTGLHARPLLGEDELTAGEVLLRRREQDCHLNRKDVLSVQILMETVEVAGAVLEEKRSRTQLSPVMASLDEICVFLWVTSCYPHCLVPTVRNGSKSRIQDNAQVTHKRRQRIAEVFVFALSEAVPCHNDTASKDGILGIETSGGLAFLKGQNAWQKRAAPFVKIVANLKPVQAVDTSNGSVRRD